MGRLYTKLKDPDGKLTLAEMTRYNRYNALDKNIIRIMKENYGVVSAELNRLPAKMYNETFFRYGWAFDQNSQVSLTWGGINEDAIKAVANNPLDLIAKDTLPVATRNRIRTAMAQRLLQGKSYPKMMKDISKATARNAYEAMRIARTEGQRAVNEATDVIYTRAHDNGIRGDDIWDATLDSRTRPTTEAQRIAGINHRVMDGVKRPKSGLFVLPNGERVRHPVAPNLSAKQAINCRCRLRFQVTGYAPSIRRTRDQGIIPYTTFDDWKGNLNDKGKFVGTIARPGDFK